MESGAMRTTASDRGADATLSDTWMLTSLWANSPTGPAKRRIVKNPKKHVRRIQSIVDPANVIYGIARNVMELSERSRAELIKIILI